MAEHNCNCGSHEPKNDIAEKIARLAPDEDALFDAAELLKVFGDSTRIRIIFVLCKGELCGDLSPASRSEAGKAREHTQGRQDDFLCALR